MFIPRTNDPTNYSLAGVPTVALINKTHPLQIMFAIFSGVNDRILKTNSIFTPHAGGIISLPIFHISLCISRLPYREFHPSDDLSISRAKLESAGPLRSVALALVGLRLTASA